MRNYSGDGGGNLSVIKFCGDSQGSLKIILACEIRIRKEYLWRVLGSADSITERLRLVSFREHLTIVESKVIGEIHWRNFFSNSSNKLFIKHILDVVHALSVSLSDAVGML